MIANLSGLMTLFQNKLSGGLPKEIGMLQKLEILFLYENQLSGGIHRKPLLLKGDEKSDIYSMGIVLLEVVTGRMRIAGTFGENVDLARWVKSRIEMQEPEREEIIDTGLKPLLPQEENAAFQVLEIGLQSTKTAPVERPSSRQVCDLLILNENRLVIDAGPDLLCNKG
ncbi:putative non-specific serine/threonine protein kinase [Helianthus anomalus]